MKTTFSLLCAMLIASLAAATPAPSTIYLPLIMKQYVRPVPSGLLQPGDFAYLGAFRLPEGGERPLTFGYGGNAMTFRPDGDAQGAGDGFPGSLFIVGHERLAYGELPDGSQIAEVSIPAPLLADEPTGLNQAAFVQGFHDVAANAFHEMDELPRLAMQYLNHPATGPLIHLGWGQHLGPEQDVSTNAWFSPDLAAPNLTGGWRIAGAPLYAVNGYMTTIPDAWAAAHVDGQPLATGRFRDGGWSGMGPALYAFQPWTDAAGTPAQSGSALPATVLLHYQDSSDADEIVRCVAGYQHPDEWEGVAWLSAADGRAAVLFAGTKGVGAKYWYGFINPAGPEYPCVFAGSLEEADFTPCRLADGSPCPSEDMQAECVGHNDSRGWWSSAFDAQFILYDPADLARVAAGELASWEPQPYAVLDIDPWLFLNAENDELGYGVQRRFRIGDIAHDREHGLLYVLEWFADGDQPVVHVWRVG